MRALGAIPTESGTDFRVWAPNARSVAVRIGGSDHDLARADDAVWEASLPAHAGGDYVYVLDGDAWPDPGSRAQPQGLKGPSRIVDTSAFDITPGPKLKLAELVLYELHVGTFSPEGTFDGVVPRLRELRDLGITAIELMPVATGPGNRNWGYDGVYTSAPHPAYGGPDGLARLVDAAHEEGLGVIMDVVYNHVGPGSEAIAAFGPYFTDRHETFWGSAIDYSHRGVREWTLQNAELWTRDYRIDGLRLDAVHAIYDESDPHILKELKQRVGDALVISEMNHDDFTPIERWGHDAQWLDSLHHHLHVLLTGERDGYYESFGSIDGLVRELQREPHERLVVCAQNHDQVGNRALGDRLPPDAHRVALACVLFSLNTPLVFMGEEYEEQRPFQFFTDHIDREIARATREGRKREFQRFTAFSGEDLPDPQDEQTFLRSKLEPREPDPFFRELLALRTQLPRELDVEAEGDRVTLKRGGATLTLDFANKAAELHRRRLDGAGPGAEVPASPVPERER
jgi:maltooligosyltrehalose trehalohydrolase